MNFELSDGVQPLMVVVSDNEEKAWEQVHKAGIKNKSNVFELVEV